MNSAEWILISFDTAEFRRKVNVHGRTIEVSVSPYDIPEAFRTWVDEALCKAYLEFRYINPDEDTRLVNIPRQIDLKVGKASGRVYRVEFSIDPKIIREKDVDGVQKRLAEVVQTINEVASNYLKQSNSEMVQSAITSHSVELAY